MSKTTQVQQSPHLSAEPESEGPAGHCQSTSPILVSSGLASVDRRLGGGMPLGKLGVICGPEGCGKTTYGLQIARMNAERGLVTRFVTFCMDGQEYSRWYLNALRGDCPRSQLESCLTNFGVLDFTWNDQEADCVELIEEYLQEDRANGIDVKVLVVDSLEEMERCQPGGPPGSLSRYFERLGDLAYSLGKLASRNDVAIWLTDRANQFSEHTSRAIKKATRGCRKISDSAFVWLGLSPISCSDNWVIRCHKNGLGPTFSTDIRPDVPFRRFLDLETRPSACSETQAPVPASRRFNAGSHRTDYRCSWSRSPIVRWDAADGRLVLIDPPSYEAPRDFRDTAQAKSPEPK